MARAARRKAASRKTAYGDQMTQAQITRLAKEFADVVDEVEDERASGGGVWFHLRDGYESEDSHMVHEWEYESARAMLEAAREFDYNALCEDCQRHPGSLARAIEQENRKARKNPTRRKRRR